MKNIHVLPTNQKSKIFFNHNKGFEKYQFSKEPFVNGLTNTSNQNIYITSDEEIKEWFIVNGINGYSQPMKYSVMFPKDKFPNGHDKNKLSLSKIILTTDPDLIKDGVQAIDDEFLEWFVKNPSCERVEVNDWLDNNGNIAFGGDIRYQIIIPQEEPKTNLEKLPFPKLVKEFAEYYKKVPLVEEPKQIKCYCGHTITCDCEPLQETLEEAAKRMYGNDEDGYYVQKRAFKIGAEWQQKQLCNSEIIQRIRSTK